MHIQSQQSVLISRLIRLTYYLYSSLFACWRHGRHSLFIIHSRSALLSTDWTAFNSDATK